MKKRKGVLLLAFFISILAMEGTNAQDSLAIAFDGNADKILVDPDSELEFTEGTIELWVRPNEYNYNGALTALRDGSSTRFSFHLNPTTGLVGLFNGFNFLSMSTGIRFGEWYHLAFVISSSDVRVYVNGTDQGLLGGTINTGVTGLKLSLGSPTPLEMSNEMYDGAMDEVRLWNVQRTGTEIEASYNTQLEGTETGLVAYYNFNNTNATAGGDNAGQTTLTDITGNGNDGTLNGFALSGTASNWVEQGWENALPLPPCGEEFSEGTGTVDDPCQISTVDQLQAITNNLDKHYALIDNIDATATANWNGGAGFIPIGGSFSGSLDGKGYTITGLVINRDHNQQPIPIASAGMFNGIATGAVIKNLILENIQVRSRKLRAGGVAAFNDGTIQNVTVTGSVTGYITGFSNPTGGIVGTNQATGVLRNVHFSGTVHADAYKPAAGSIVHAYYVGGITGRNDGYIVSSSARDTFIGEYGVGGLVGMNFAGGVIDSSSAIGAIMAEIDFGLSRAGGITGTNYSTTNGLDAAEIKNSWADVDIIEPSAELLGGIAGNNEGVIERSYALGDISGNNYVGGIAGYVSAFLETTKRPIIQSYAAGNITGTGTSIGGLAGHFAYVTPVADSIVISESYFAGELSGPSPGGLVGNFLRNYSETEPGDTILTVKSYWDADLSGVSNTVGGGEAKTTAEMQLFSTFTGWDFENTWNINGGYPYFGNQDPFLNITGNEGWRMLSSPVEGTTYAEILDPIWTQGIAGSDSPDYGNPNVYTWNEATQSWQAPSSLNEMAIPGQGFIVYVYADDDFDGTPDDFPKTLTTDKDKFTGNAAPSLSYTVGESTELSGWNLTGNTYFQTIDWDAGSGWTRTNMDETFYVWSDSANGGLGSYLSWNGESGTLQNGKVAPWQGFWVKANGADPGFSFTEEVKNQEGIFRKQAAPKQLKLTLKDSEHYSNTVLWFSDKAQTGKDRFDAYKLESLNADYLSIGTQTEENGVMDIQALPTSLNQQEIDVVINGSNLSGKFELRWDMQSLPKDAHYILRDNETGEEFDLREQSAISFELSEAAAKTAPTQSPGVRGKSAEESLIPRHGVMTPKVMKTKTGQSHRFTLTITFSQTVPNEPFNDLPEQVELAQNYPNPFNPTTTINYGVPETGEVSIEVFDLLGRKVATLINRETQQAGRYSVQFDAGKLASGLYLYRLKAGNTVLTKKLTLIK